MKLSAALLRDIGRTLYGDNFVARFAKALDVNPRNLERWLAADKPAPETLVPELRKLLRSHFDHIMDRLQNDRE